MIYFYGVITSTPLAWNQNLRVPDATSRVPFPCVKHGRNIPVTHSLPKNARGYALAHAEVRGLAEQAFLAYRKWPMRKQAINCENNDMFGLVILLANMADSIGTTQRLVHTINGKTVYLIKTTDKLTSRIKTLNDALSNLDQTFTTWKAELNTFRSKEHCHYDVTMEFLSRYTMQVNRALSSLLRLFELEEFTRQASYLSQQEFIGLQDLPHAISTELTAQLSSIPELQATDHALRGSYSLLIRPLLDYDFTHDHKFRFKNIIYCSSIFCEQRVLHSGVIDTSQVQLEC